MNGEIPVCKRCCFCLPLRYGLIVWGYIKLIATAVLITLLSYSLMYTVMMMRLYENNAYVSRIYSEIIVASIVLCVLFMDFMLVIIFIVGGHMKKLKLLRVFYVYSIIVWALTIFLVAVAVGISIDNWLSRHSSIRSWMMHMLDYSAFFVNIVAQTYFLLLQRSEIIKLRSNCEFRFVNHAAQAECIMSNKEVVYGNDTDTEEV